NTLSGKSAEPMVMVLASSLQPTIAPAARAPAARVSPTRRTASEILMNVSSTSGDGQARRDDESLHSREDALGDQRQCGDEEGPGQHLGEAADGIAVDQEAPQPAERGVRRDRRGRDDLEHRAADAGED